MKRLLAILLTISVLVCFGLFATASGSTGNSVSTTTSESSTTSEETTTVATTTTTTEMEDNDDEEDDEDDDAESDGVTPELKAYLDSYEAFMDEYIEFMTLYKENPTDIAYVTQYATMLAKYAEFAHAIEEYDTEEMSDADVAYYMEVTTRVSQKMMEASLDMSDYEG